MRSSQKGFTLVELLIVIAIIGVLSTISLFSLVGNQARARDGKRKADLKSIQSALELYRADKGVYPNGTGSLGGYITTVPTDPKTHGAYTYTPAFGASGTVQNYTMYAKLENTNDPDITSSGCTSSGCPGNGSANYQVTNP